MGRLFITGDTHGVHTLGKLLDLESKLGQTLSKSDYVVVCGDFGLVWYDDHGILRREKDNYKKQQAALDKLGDCGFTTLFVPGNHENYDLLETKKEVDMFGSKARKVSDSVFMLQTGHEYDICGKKTLVFGGGVSRDREWRQSGISWWKQEVPSQEVLEQTLEIVCGQHYDLVLTHSAPSSMLKQIDKSFTTDKVTDMLEKIKCAVTFGMWCFGHYHVDIELGYFRSLYDDIIELGVI